MNDYYFEVTDTFGNELNYCWLKKFIIVAKNERGAINKLARHLGLNFRFNGSYYKAKNACIGAYILDCEVYEVDEIWKEKAEIL